MQVQDKGTVLMKDLQIGDSVLVSSGTYEPVYTFGHRHETIKAEFLQLMPSGLELSRDHMVMVQGQGYIPASLVRRGDVLESDNGKEMMAVQDISNVVRHGVYAPFTSSGSIAVNHIKASNYISFQESAYLVIGGWESPLTFQWVAHMSQSPQRVCRLLGWSPVSEVYSEDGISTWVSGPLEWYEWVLEQNGVIMTVILVPVIGIGLLSLAVEGAISWFDSYFPF